jgi:glycosyltransferase A (GT-A) superfamily protein (DUF2064 family)
MVARTLAAAREAGLEVTVWFTPSDAGPEMRYWLGDSCDFRPQASGGLGVRLATAERAADANRPWLALVGDCPGIDVELLREVAAIAERGDVAIGPTMDGGYYLIGGMPRCRMSSPPCHGTANGCWPKPARGSRTWASRGASCARSRWSRRSNTREPSGS